MIYILYTYISLITYTCVKTHSETRSAEASAADLENFQECQRQATGFFQIRAEMCERRRRLVGVRGTATISTEHSSATPDCWVSQWGHQCMPLWHLSPVQEVCHSLREKRPAKWTVHVFVLWRLGRRTRSALPFREGKIMHSRPSPRCASLPCQLAQRVRAKAAQS